MRGTGCLYLLVLFLSSSAVIAYPRAKKPGPAYIFGTKVNIRKSSALDSTVIGSALIGEEIQIVRKLDSKLAIEGREDYWYEITYRGKSGYIWGGLIADQHYNISDKDIFLIKNYTSGPYSLEHSSGSREYEFRRSINNRMVASIKEQGFGKEYGFANFSTKKYSSFKEEFILLAFDYSASGEIEVNGKYFYYIKNNSLKQVFNFAKYGGEGGEGFSSTITFPSDNGGIFNCIVVSTASESMGEIKDTHRSVRCWDIRSKTFVERGP